jgi:hypothetical protein
LRRLPSRRRLLALKLDVCCCGGTQNVILYRQARPECRELTRFWLQEPHGRNQFAALISSCNPSLWLASGDPCFGHMVYSNGVKLECKIIICDAPFHFCQSTPKILSFAELANLKISYQTSCLSLSLTATKQMRISKRGLLKSCIPRCCRLACGGNVPALSNCQVCRAFSCATRTIRVRPVANWSSFVSD